jgi:hypothetical protein
MSQIRAAVQLGHYARDETNNNRPNYAHGPFRASRQLAKRQAGN